MIFLTKKKFEEQVAGRMEEIRFKTRTDEELWKLRDEVRELKYRLDAIEQTIRQPVPVNPATGTNPYTYEPAPYWTNPQWKAPDITCTTANPPQS